MDLDAITENAQRIVDALPEDVELVAAAKSRTVAEVMAAIEGGVQRIGHNYVQEAEAMIPYLEADVEWHLIGHLQRNKAKKAVDLFDVVETLDSHRLAAALERRCAAQSRSMPCLVEVNSGKESSKTGVLPGEVRDFVEGVAELEHLEIVGLMTMGPRFGDPNEARSYFKATRRAFDELSSLELPGVSMRYLSMGMSLTWHVAIDEGANVVRIGTELFGERD